MIKIFAFYWAFGLKLSEMLKKKFHYKILNVICWNRTLTTLTSHFYRSCYLLRHQEVGNFSQYHILFSGEKNHSIYFICLSILVSMIFKPRMEFPQRLWFFPWKYYNINRLHLMWIKNIHVYVYVLRIKFGINCVIVYYMKICEIFIIYCNN